MPVPFEVIEGRPQLITFQQIVMNDRQDMFEQDVNALLMDGWRVVPGTFAVCSFEQAANATHRFQTPAGTTFRNKFFITLERTEARSCASPSPALC